MSYFDWTPDLDTHIELVDEQHKILVRCINELHEANQRKDFEAEGKIIEDLIRYTVEHFSDEEKLMDDAGYPLSKQHKQIHQRFVDKVRESNKNSAKAKTSDKNCWVYCTTGCLPISAITTKVSSPPCKNIWPPNPLTTNWKPKQRFGQPSKIRAAHKIRRHSPPLSTTIQLL